MSYWFFPQILTEALRQAALNHSQLLIPSQGLPMLSRAQDAEQIADWLRKIAPDTPPETIAAQKEYWWQLGHELLIDDIIVVPVQNGDACMIGEITGVYRQEILKEETFHIWSVHWLSGHVLMESLGPLKKYLYYKQLAPISEEDELKSLRSHIPSLKRSNLLVFRWVAITTLLFELIYFWPR